MQIHTLIRSDKFNQVKPVQQEDKRWCVHVQVKAKGRFTVLGGTDVRSKRQAMGICKALRATKPVPVQVEEPKAAVKVAKSKTKRTAKPKTQTTDAVAQLRAQMCAMQEALTVLMETPGA